MWRLEGRGRQLAFQGVETGMQCFVDMNKAEGSCGRIRESLRSSRCGSVGDKGKSSKG